MGVTKTPAVPILVHCHLRWDFVWQRPQQIFSRLAANHPVLFLEEAMASEGEARLEISRPQENLFRVVPMVPGCQSMSMQAQCEIVRPLLLQALHSAPELAGRFEMPVQWFYSPITAPFFIDRVPSAAIVYDCMDELANFRYASSDLAQREKLLLSRADVVFTGGYKLYESKSMHNANTHFHGCGVDIAHFGKARLHSTPVPKELAGLPRPIFGYFGVIDERLDYELLAHLAGTFPNASIAMVGPFAKIDPSALPRLPNIHWLGQRQYADLPSFVKGFDVCLMPFALNEATQYINPTKTLEYMAAAKPIVSTAVPDVVRNFTPVVRIGTSAEDFAKAVDESFWTPDVERIDEGVRSAESSSWDAIVGAMRKHMVAAVERRHPAQRQASPARVLHAGRPKPHPSTHPSAIHIGGTDRRIQSGDTAFAATGRAE